MRMTGDLSLIPNPYFNLPRLWQRCSINWYNFIRCSGLRISRIARVSNLSSTRSFCKAWRRSLVLLPEAALSFWSRRIWTGVRLSSFPNLPPLPAGIWGALFWAMNSCAQTGAIDRKVSRIMKIRNVRHMRCDRGIMTISILDPELRWKVRTSPAWRKKDSQA